MKARMILSVLVVVLLVAAIGWYAFRETNPRIVTTEEQLATAESDRKRAHAEAVKSGLLLEKVKLYEQYKRIPNPTFEERAKAQELLEEIARERPDLVELKSPK